MKHFVYYTIGGLLAFGGMFALGYGAVIADGKVKQELNSTWWRGFNVGTVFQKAIDRNSQESTEETPKQEED